MSRASIRRRGDDERCTWDESVVERLNILHLIAYPLYSGPVAPTLALARRQEFEGHCVAIACDSKRGNFDGYEEPALPRLEASGLLADLGLTLSTQSSPLELMRDVARLRARFAHGDLDIVHVHMSHDHSLASIARQGVRRAPNLVRTFHARRSLKGRLGQGVLNRSAQGWIVRSRDDRYRLLEKFSLSAERTVLIAGSIDPDVFAPCSEEERRRSRCELGLPEDEPVIGHVALLANRGQFELLEALGRLRDSKLHILFVGRGQDEERLRHHVDHEDLGSRVHFAGYLRDEALLGAYSAMDAAFVAGAGNDASVRAALEAMSSALPVVGVADGAIQEYLADGAGYLCRTRDPSAIATSLAAWLSDDGAGARGREARARVQSRYRIDRETAETLELYRRCRS